MTSFFQGPNQPASGKMLLRGILNNVDYGLRPDVQPEIHRPEAKTTSSDQAGQFLASTTSSETLRTRWTQACPIGPPLFSN